jgi:hypothetical protein
MVAGRTPHPDSSPGTRGQVSGRTRQADPAWRSSTQAARHPGSKPIRRVGDAGRSRPGRLPLFKQGVSRTTWSP